MHLCSWGLQLVSSLADAAKVLGRASAAITAGTTFVLQRQLDVGDRQRLFYRQHRSVMCSLILSSSTHNGPSV